MENVVLIDVIGWVGATLLAICSIPQTLLSIKQKHSDGVSSLFLMLWYFGTLLTGIYVAVETSSNYPLMANYLINFIMLQVIVYYKYFPSRS